MVLFQSDMIEIDILRFLSAIAALALYSKFFFEWLRLFEITAFYSKLVKEAIRDTTYFMLVFLVTIFLFGVPSALIGLTWQHNLEKEELFRTNPAMIFYA